MTEKTRGIVLQQIRYGDNSRIVHIYTERFGKLVFMVKGLGKRSKLQRAVFHPLSLIDLEISYKRDRSMQHIKDVQLSVPLLALHTDIPKTTIALFISEVLSKTLKEEEANPALFEFLYNMAVGLNKEEELTGIFHLIFLARLTQYLGFQPANRFDGHNIYFDLREGAFVPALPPHPDFMDKEDAEFFSSLLPPSTTPDKSKASFTTRKKDFLTKLIRYYRIHLEGMGKINSLDILHKIFH